MKPGDKIAIKASFVRKHILPFAASRTSRKSTASETASRPAASARISLQGFLNAVACRPFYGTKQISTVCSQLTSRGEVSVKSLAGDAEFVTQIGYDRFLLSQSGLSKSQFRGRHLRTAGGRLIGCSTPIFACNVVSGDA